MGTNVLAKTCAVADAYATAFMVMDLDSVMNILDSQKELEAYIIYLDEAGETHEIMTDGFRALVLD